MKRSLHGALGLAVLFLAGVAAAEPPGIPLPGLRAPAQITRDTNGIAHIRAAQDHDLYFLQGWVHAQDRLFQMDERRRLASGTYAELVGEAALATDQQLRAIGLRRAAERSLAAVSPQTRDALEAYAEGVNAFVSNHDLPLEYQLLGLTQFEPWTALDSVAVGKLITFDLAFELDIALSLALDGYQKTFSVEQGTVLFFEDVFRSAPFDPASTIPDASLAPAAAFSTSGARSRAAVSAAAVHPAAVELGKQYLAALKDNPIFQRLRTRERRGGSNEWAVSGAHTASGFAILANDPHLDLTTPSTFYPIHLATGSRNVIGSGFAGIPFVVLGHNEHIAWGATQNPLDVTDTFLEMIVPDPASPSGLSTVYKDQLEPIILIPEVFRVNPLTGGELIPMDGEPTLVVPRRNNGPIVAQLEAGFALSVQYTGFSPTRELDTFRMWNEAQNLQDFRRGLAFLDVGSQNFGYADVRGNIAYFVGGELPLREDLQAGMVNGAPPFLIRDGRGGNEWIPLPRPRPDQAVPYEILPAEEMPQIVNPPAGFFVSANNDPIGTTLDNNPLNQVRPGGGLLYLSHFYDGYRAGRVTQIIRAKLANGGKLSFADMPQIQADTVLIDAQFFVPQIAAAFTRALASSNPALQALAENGRVVEAKGRLLAWDFSTPTGIPEGYDASDENGQLSPSPSSQEVAASVAATIYAVWRSRLIANTIDAVVGPLPRPDGERTLGALRRLLEIYDANDGLGASGVSFFGEFPDGRDLVILRSLKEALEALADPAVFAVFGSPDQNTYRWGKLHRVVLRHSLGDPFNVPPALGAFPHPLPPLPGLPLPGIPTDGGFSTVDAGTHDVRGASSNGFMFPAGPVHRFVAEMAPSGVRAVSSLPGGVSGNIDSLALDLLRPYLTNDTFPLWFRASEVDQHAGTVTRFRPAH
jgi:penicillin amidase